MIFQHTWQKVLDGSKTQTRRLAKPGDYLQSHLVEGVTFKSLRNTRNHRIIWFSGEDYAIQPGRGQKSVGRFWLKDIRCEDVREISDADAWAEGGYDIQSYLCLWASMHDKALGAYYEDRVNSYGFKVNKTEPRYDYIDAEKPRVLLEYYRRRPDERYQAWVLDFELVTP